MVTYPCPQVVSQSAECYPVPWHHCNRRGTSRVPHWCLQLSGEYSSSERLLRKMCSNDHPALTSQGFPEVRSSCLLDVICGDDADDDDEEGEIANVNILLNVSQAGTIPNGFFIFIQFCQQFKEAAIITVSVLVEEQRGQVIWQRSLCS